MSSGINNYRHGHKQPAAARLPREPLPRVKLSRTERCFALIAGALLSLSTFAAAPSAQPLEVMHWLTSSHDAAALAVVREAFTSRGGSWVESPMPGPGGTGRTAAVNRIVGGLPPGAFQFSLGSQLVELATAGMIAPVRTNTQWDAAIPASIALASKYGGRDIAVPMNIRGENWMFYNSAVLRRAGVAVPRTWDDFLAAAIKLKATGITPIALGGQAWQERLLFNSVLLGTGGREFYRRIYEQVDERAIGSAAMLRTYSIFGALRQFVDSGSPGRRWNQTTAFLIQGHAAFLFMGDWAKNEIIAVGLEPGVQIGCALAPAPEPAYIMMVDAFAFGRLKTPALEAAQNLFAQTLRDPKVQARMAQKLGAIPVRTDISDSGFDICSKHAMSIIREPQAQLLDPFLTLAGGLSGALDDAISQYWNQKELSAEQGRKMFLEAVKNNR